MGKFRTAEMKLIQIVRNNPEPPRHSPAMNWKLLKHQCYCLQSSNFTLPLTERSLSKVEAHASKCMHSNLTHGQTKSLLEESWSWKLVFEECNIHNQEHYCIYKKYYIKRGDGSIMFWYVDMTCFAASETSERPPQHYLTLSARQMKIQQNCMFH